MRSVRSFACLLALLLGVGAMGGCDTPRSQIDAHELATTAKSLASLSGEAQLLSQQLSARSVTPQFGWVHQQALAEESLKLSRQLAKPVPAELRATHEAISALNARFAVEVTRIAQVRASPEQLAGLEHDLQQLARDARAAEQRL